MKEYALNRIPRPHCKPLRRVLVPPAAINCARFAHFIAALLVGMIDVMGRSYLDGFMKLLMDNQSAETASPALSAMAIYILMAGILYFRPRGLFPPRHR